MTRVQLGSCMAPVSVARTPPSFVSFRRRLAHSLARPPARPLARPRVRGQVARVCLGGLLSLAPHNCAALSSGLARAKGCGHQSRHAATAHSFFVIFFFSRPSLVAVGGV